MIYLPLAYEKGCINEWIYLLLALEGRINKISIYNNSSFIYLLPKKREYKFSIYCNNEFIHLLPQKTGVKKNLNLRYISNLLISHLRGWEYKFLIHSDNRFIYYKKNINFQFLLIINLFILLWKKKSRNFQFIIIKDLFTIRGV